MASKAAQYEQLTAYLDGELSDAECQEVERMLEQDAEARRLLDELRRTSRLVASLPRGSAPPDFSASVMARLERRELLGEGEVKGRPRKARSLWWVRPVAVAAGLALLLTAGWLSWQETRPPVGTASPTALRSKDRALAPLRRDEGAWQRSTDTPERIAFAEKGRTDEREFAPAAAAPQAVKQVVSAATEAEPRALQTAEKQMPSASPPTQSVVAVSPPAPGGGQAGGICLGIVGPPRPGLEAQLADSTLTKFSALNTDLSALSNRVELTTDAETGRRLASEMALFLRDSDVPDLRTVNLPEPLTAVQPFYFTGAEVRSTPASMKSLGGIEASQTSQPAETTYIVVNAPASLVGQMLAASQRFGRMRNAEMSWAANGVEVATVHTSERDASSAVLRRLRQDGEPEGGLESRREEQRAKELAGQELRGAQVRERQEAEHVTAEDAKSETTGGGAVRARPAGRPSARGATTGETTSPVPYGRPSVPAQAGPNRGFVTLAILIHVAEPTTQPTTREAAGE